MLYYGKQEEMELLKGSRARSHDKESGHVTYSTCTSEVACTHNHMIAKSNLRYPLKLSALASLHYYDMHIPVAEMLHRISPPRLGSASRAVALGDRRTSGTTAPGCSIRSTCTPLHSAPMITSLPCYYF